MYKQTVGHPINGILFSTKKKFAMKPQKDLKSILLSEKPI